MADVKKVHTVVSPAASVKKSSGLGAFAADLFEGIKDAVPDLTRLGAGVTLRALASNPLCVEVVAKTMAADEEVDWEGLSGPERRTWKLRAKAAFVGIDQFVAAMSRPRV